MKKIVILTCMKSTGTSCTGATCLSAFYDKTGGFEQYGDEELRLTAFCQCNGCGNYVDKDEGLQKKIKSIVDMQPYAVHVGVCTLRGEPKKRCGTIQKMIDILDENGIRVIDGTHNSTQLPEIGKIIIKRKI